MTPDQRYARCELLVVGWEGDDAYTNNPKDAGGPTRFGVTLAALSAWRGRTCTAADVQQLGADEAKAIYRAVYWSHVAGDQLPAGPDLIVFDAAVNMGRDQAVHCLQRALGVGIDGDLGSKTLAAVAGVNDRVGLVARIRTARAAAYATFAAYPIFGHGWINRLNACASAATAWAVKGAAPCS